MNKMKPKYTLLRKSMTDQRVFSRDDKPGFLYFADHSGDGLHDSVGRPNETDDGPLRWEIPDGPYHRNRLIVLSPSRYGGAGATAMSANLSVVSERDGKTYTIGICQGLATWLQANYGCICVIRINKKLYEFCESSINPEDYQ